MKYSKDTYQRHLTLADDNEISATTTTPLGLMDLFT